MTFHSKLGFSSAERWFRCPGSVALIDSLPAGAGEGDPTHRNIGTAAHAAWAECLRNGLDAWEVSGQEWEGVRLGVEDCRAGQFYLDTVRQLKGNTAKTRPLFAYEGIELSLSARDLHPLAYGTIDYLLIVGSVCNLIDYKHGVGIYVDVERNWQLMGYGALVLRHWPQIEHFRFCIVQPRCEGAEPSRVWECTADDLWQWEQVELIPAMNRAASASASDLHPGEWCRFCRAKEAIACPAAADLLAVPEPPTPAVTDEALGKLYELLAPARIHAQAVEREVLRRRLIGIDVPGSKTVAKRSVRVWKSGAEPALVAALGPDALTAPELKSPAVVEDMSSLGKELVREHAYSPDTGYSVAPLSDRRKAVTVQKPAEIFQNFVDISAEGE